MQKISALFILLIISPIWIIISILIYIFDGRPIFYGSQRVGENYVEFKLYKFRTMNNDRDRDQNLLPDKERLGNFGKLLRSIIIDELPALINVLKGEMSLVGPRPLLLRYLDKKMNCSLDSVLGGE